MALTSREIFKKWDSFLGVTALGDTADSISVGGKNITFIVISGNVWINPDATAVADATALKLIAGQAVDIGEVTTLSIISDATGATYEYIIYEI